MTRLVSISLAFACFGLLATTAMAGDFRGDKQGPAVHLAVHGAHTQANIVEVKKYGHGGHGYHGHPGHNRHYGHGHHGYYRAPVVMYPPVYARPQVVVPAYPYYYNQPHGSFYFNGPRFSFGIGY